MTVHASPSIAAGATALALLAFHAPDPVRTAKASTLHRTPPVITVTATDYRLALPDTLAAGPTTFRVVNNGRELHHLLFVRLDGGHTSAELARAMRGDGPPPAWARLDGGPNGVSPHETSLTTTVDLAAGHYAVLCMIPGPDGVPHLAKGMLGDVDVLPANNPAPLPPYDASISLFDYGFKSSPPITRDTRRVLVRNDGVQPHELELVRLLPGKTMADLSAWAQKMAGPPPAEFLGGVSPIAPGGTNELALSLPPGHYVMLCFLPDATDHAPHVAHGMVHDFVVS